MTIDCRMSELMFTQSTGTVTNIIQCAHFTICIHNNNIIIIDYATTILNLVLEYLILILLFGRV